LIIDVAFLLLGSIIFIDEPPEIYATSIVEEFNCVDFVV